MSKHKPEPPADISGIEMTTIRDGGLMSSGWIGTIIGVLVVVILVILILNLT